MNYRDLIKKTFSLQKDQTDCGVSCIQSLVRYYGGEISLEILREKSGTTKHGTTLLGLYQCANSIGFNAEGCESDLNSLIKHNEPVILHVVIDEKIEHFVIFYHKDSFKNNKFLIGDPSKGLVYWSQDHLKSVWKSRSCLVLTPNVDFKKFEVNNLAKKKWFLKLIKEDRNNIFTIIFLGTISTFLGMTMSIFSQLLLDIILPQNNINILLFGLIFFGFVLILKILIQALKSYYVIEQSKDFNLRINKEFFSSLFILPKIFFDTRKIGDFVSRLNDTQRIQNIIKLLITNTITDILGIFVSISFLFYYSWKLTCVCIILSPLIFYIIFRFNNKVTECQKNIMQAYGGNESNYIDTIRGIDIVKSFSKQNHFLKRNIYFFENLQKNIYELGKLNLKISLQSGLFLTFTLLIILSFSSYGVLIGMIKIGELMAIIGITSSLMGSITNLALLSIHIQEARVAFDRMYEYYSIEKENINGSIIKELTSIEIYNVDFRFNGRSLLLNNISLKLKRGKITLLLGESGSGKTTLTEVLQKNYIPDSGKIIINNNIDLKTISIKNWRQHISIVPQHTQVFNGNLLENIILDNEVDEQKLKKIISYGFDNFIDSLPQGFTTIIGEEGINLSGGQKQLLGWMRALYHNPRLLILDEPTSSLDKNNKNFIYNLIYQLKSELIIFIISHHSDDLTIADEVFVLENTKIQKSKKI